MDDTESQKSINREGKEIPLVEIKQVNGKNSGSVLRDGDTAWDGDAQQQSIGESSRRQSSNNFPQMAATESTSHDERERNMRHMV